MTATERLTTASRTIRRRVLYHLARRKVGGVGMTTDPTGRGLILDLTHLGTTDWHGTTDPFVSAAHHLETRLHRAGVPRLASLVHADNRDHIQETRS